MVATNLTIKTTSIVLACVVCGSKINVTLYPDRKYKNGHYFGKMNTLKKKQAEYWECNNCYKEAYEASRFS